MGRWAARRRLLQADKTIELHLQPNRVAAGDKEALLGVAELAALHIAKSGLPFEQLQADALGFLIAAYVMGQNDAIADQVNV